MSETQNTDKVLQIIANVEYKRNLERNVAVFDEQIQNMTAQRDLIQEELLTLEITEEDENIYNQVVGFVHQNVKFS